METTTAKTTAKNPYDFGKYTFLILVHVGALLGIGLWAKGMILCTGKSVALASIWFGLSCAAITAGYHRLFSHPTYRATWALKLFYLLWGEAAVHGSVLDW